MKTLPRKVKTAHQVQGQKDELTVIVPKGCILVSSQRPLKNGDTEHTFWAE